MTNKRKFAQTKISHYTVYITCAVYCFKNVCVLHVQVNPFRARICTIFSAGGNGKMSFIEFLDMVSAFSPKVHKITCNS